MKISNTELHCLCVILKNILKKDLKDGENTQITRVISDARNGQLYILDVNLKCLDLEDKKDV